VVHGEGAAKHFRSSNRAAMAGVNGSNGEIGKFTQEDEMNWDRVEGNWKQFTGKAKENWGKLTDDDLTVINGKQDQLIGRIQERYGVAKDDAQKQVNRWIGDL
jgi:uncharacterized protein YjbJ (UPF0337 family)